jgi:hypothetical protein
VLHNQLMNRQGRQCRLRSAAVLFLAILSLPCPCAFPSGQTGVPDGQKSAQADASIIGPDLVEILRAEVRAGNESEARLTINKLANLKPQRLWQLKDPHGSARQTVQEKWVLSETADYLIERQRWELAKLYLEKLPRSEPGRGNCLVEHWVEQAGKDTGKIDAIDAWLSANLAASPDYWNGLRADLASASGRLEHFFADMETACRRNAGDAAPVRLYLTLTDRYDQSRDVSWIARDIHPLLAYDNFRLAESLQAGHPSEAAIFLERCRSMPFTSADQKAISDFMKENSQMALIGFHDWQAEFSRWVRGLLSECYQKTGASKKAQALLLELSREEKGIMPYYALSQLAGSIQASTPQHPLEDQIKKAEPANENSPDYWQGRARYYEGRKDYAQQKKALEKALQLTRLKDTFTPERVLRRSMAVWDYACCLKAGSGEPAALSFLWKEFEANNNQEFRQRILNDILESLETDNTHYLSGADERLWNFLTNAKQWDYFEERLLWRMARNTSKDQSGKLFRRAEKLAYGESTREKTLGWIMNRCGQPAHSLAPLTAACRHLNGEMQKQAFFFLFESYLDLSDWMNAEKIWPRAKELLTETECPDWLGRIAVAAAKRHDKQDALRLWKKKDELDFAALCHLDELKKLGMKQDLIDYYRKKQKSLPSSTVPAEALKFLSR